MTIYPKHNGIDWVFTDESVGLIDEPFVYGIDEMLTELYEELKSEFKLDFSSSPIFDYDIELTFIESEFNGNWYSDGKRKGWLCPALFKYFEKVPNKLYIKGTKI